MARNYQREYELKKKREAEKKEQERKAAVAPIKVDNVLPDEKIVATNVNRAIARLMELEVRVSDAAISDSIREVEDVLWATRSHI